MLCAAMKVWKRTACWLSAQLPAAFTFSASPAQYLDQFRVLLSQEGLIPLGNGSGSHRNYFYCLNLEHFVSSICWELFSKQSLYLKWHSEFSVCHQCSCQPAQKWQWALLPHTALLWMATAELLWRAVPLAEVGSWLLISLGYSAHCCVKQDAVGKWRSKESRYDILVSYRRMTSRKRAYFQQHDVLLHWKFHAVSQRSHLQAL